MTIAVTSHAVLKTVRIRVRASPTRGPKPVELAADSPTTFQRSVLPALVAWAEVLTMSRELTTLTGPVRTAKPRVARVARVAGEPKKQGLWALTAAARPPSRVAGGWPEGGRGTEKAGIMGTYGGGPATLEGGQRVADGGR
jgi:hypothetical protein